MSSEWKEKEKGFANTGNCIYKKKGRKFVGELSFCCYLSTKFKTESGKGYWRVKSYQIIEGLKRQV